MHGEYPLPMMVLVFKTTAREGVSASLPLGEDRDTIQSTTPASGVCTAHRLGGLQVALAVDTSEKSARIVKARLERTTLGEVRLLLPAAAVLVACPIASAAATPAFFFFF